MTEHNFQLDMDWSTNTQIKSTPMTLACAFCFLLLLCTKTTGVTHWKLEDNAIIPANTDLANAATQQPQEDIFAASIGLKDPEFAVLLRHSTKMPGYKASHRSTGSCPIVVNVNSQQTPNQCSSDKNPRNPDGSGPMSASAMAGVQANVLSCGEAVLDTVYDFLKGIARRNEHKAYPEPEVAMVFKKSQSDASVDLFDVEVGLRKAYKESPESLNVLNQIGNFWRIKGNTQLAIECFRKALSISPDHPDLLLNLARIMFNLKFYDDAIFLAKRSLHMKSSEHNSWLQYFTLGEVYKALEKYEEAAFYFRKSLDVNPSLHVAEMQLRELGLFQQHSVNIYTVLIILALISIVLLVIYYLISAMSSGHGMPSHHRKGS